MDLGISGRTAAVAAGTAGLGFASAKALVDAGVRVVICGRG
ncbi:MAG: SDR family NAD(P)-dependent oxidoreductase, partial [Acidimicrobiia bacterium]|nr:SDR family NAD(P)-dependent oxidoreductase [Acidimicrobiia bacterium]